MSDEERIASILGDWRARRDEGEDLTPEDVVRAHPELAASLRAKFQILEMFAENTGGEGDPHAERPLRALPDDRYAEFRPVGEGGMGIVYLAIDTDLNREVAFKVVRPGGSRDDEETPVRPAMLTPPGADTAASRTFRTLTQRFLQEAWVTAGMAHPGIVPVYELGQTGEGIPYYTMRFVRGERTLGTALADLEAESLDARLPLLEPFLKVCDTLRYAHDRGVIHRDLKPDNIALGEYGEVVVLDWGLAKINDRPDVSHERWQDLIQEYRDASDLRTVASAMGTPGYMAPEAARGDVDVMDERSDVYSLGAILFQILTGRLPFAFESFGELMDKLLHEDAPLAKDLVEETPQALSELCARCLAREAEDRIHGADVLARGVRSWQSRSAREREVEGWLREARSVLDRARTLKGAALLRELDRATGSLARLRASDPGYETARGYRVQMEALREQGIRERERGARLRVLAVGGAVTLLVAAVAGLLVSGMLRTERDAAVANMGRAERAEAEATERLWASYLNQARAGRRSDQPGRRFASLEALAAAAAIRPSLELRNEALACMPLVDMRLERSSPAPVGCTQGPVCDAELERCAFGDAEGNVSIRAVADGRELLLLPGPGRGVVWTPLFSPDGRFLAVKYEGAEQLHLWDLETGVLACRSSEAYLHDALCFHPEGRHVAMGLRDGTLRVYAVPSMELEMEVSVGVPAYMLRYSPDGRFLAISSISDSEVQVRSAETGRVLGLLPHEAGVRGVAWSPEGGRLATACADLDIRVWPITDDLYDPVPMAVLHGHHWTPVEVAFDGGGDLIVSRGWDATLRLWDAWTGRQRVAHMNTAHFLRFAPDDARLACADQTHALQLWDVARGEECRRFFGHGLGGPAQIWSIDVRAGGRIMASCADDGVRLWDVRTGQALARLPAGRAYASVFHPSGDTLVTAGTKGLHRWPIHIEGAGGDERVRVGPPIPVAGLGATPVERACWSRDGSTLAVSCPRRREAIVIRGMTNTSPPVVRRLLNPNALYLSLSPDGSRLATGTWKGHGVQVWDTDTGELVRELTTLGRSAQVAISPDGSRLATCADGALRVWDCATWEVLRVRSEPRLAGCPAFSPDGRLLVVPDESGGLVLEDAASGELLGILSAEDTGKVGWPAFSPDGRWLTAGGLRAVVFAWDLAAIREHLQAMGLDWSHPPCSAPDRRPGLRPDQIEVVLGRGGGAERR